MELLVYTVLFGFLTALALAHWIWVLTLHWRNGSQGPGIDDAKCPHCQFRRQFWDGGDVG